MKLLYRAIIFFTHYFSFLVFALRHRFYNKKLLLTNKKLILVAMIRGEELYLKEFVEFYIRQGVDYFVFYDNSDNDAQRVALSEFLLNGYVSFQRCPDFTPLLKMILVRGWHSKNRIKPQIQELALTHFVLEHKKHAGWIVQLDVDEFLFGKSRSLSDIVTELELEGVKQISIAEFEFGSSYLIDYPPSVLGYYKKRSIYPKSFKSLGRLDAISPMFNAHVFSARRSLFEALVKGVRQAKNFENLEARNYAGMDMDPLRLNHYKFKCLRDIIEKRFSGKYMTSNNRDLDQLPFFFIANNEVFCDLLEKRIFSN